MRAQLRCALLRSTSSSSFEGVEEELPVLSVSLLISSTFSWIVYNLLEVDTMCLNHFIYSTALLAAWVVVSSLAGETKLYLLSIKLCFFFLMSAGCSRLTSTLGNMSSSKGSKRISVFDRLGPGNDDVMKFVYGY